MRVESYTNTSFPFTHAGYIGYPLVRIYVTNIVLGTRTPAIVSAYFRVK